MSRTRADFTRALEGKKIPILTLDNKWHQVFSEYKGDKRIQKLEKQLNELIKEQGKCTTQSKDIKKLKAKLMKEIVGSMEEIGEGKQNKKLEKEMEEKTKLINECNEKLEAYQDELLELPGKIDKINYELMLITMETCYSAMEKNSLEIKEIGAWIKSIRTELKKKVIRKQEKEKENQRMYSYMHDIFGAEVIEIFDMEYLKKDDGEKK
ncbi:MAG: hypothetical protein NC412_14595 [Roseburia sp.]|nr:hypothetical protein [Roseburia sp.]MCM1279962.1 hypothetical protein [Robinsoniella sp.]